MMCLPLQIRLEQLRGQASLVSWYLLCMVASSWLLQQLTLSKPTPAPLPPPLRQPKNFKRVTERVPKCSDARMIKGTGLEYCAFATQSGPMVRGQASSRMTSNAVSRIWIDFQREFVTLSGDFGVVQVVSIRPCQFWGRYRYASLFLGGGGGVNGAGRHVCGKGSRGCGHKHHKGKKDLHLLSDFVCCVNSKARCRTGVSIVSPRNKQNP